MPTALRVIRAIFIAFFVYALLGEKHDARPRTVRHGSMDSTTQHTMSHQTITNSHLNKRESMKHRIADLGVSSLDFTRARVLHWHVRLYLSVKTASAALSLSERAFVADT